MSQPRRLIERFYYEVWNKGDEAVAREIIDPDFRFRGSLGSERIALDGFIGYMRSVRTALADYHCIIDDLIESDLRAAARMRFRGIHCGEIFGVPASGREIMWSGAAFFTTGEHRITELWVLGDVDSLKQQLGASEALSF
jgi:steroid delta-isomerase-like uncharacterized protein